MRNSVSSGTYQLVSEHSIQGNAPRKIRNGFEAYRERVRQIGTLKEPDRCCHGANATARSHVRGRFIEEDKETRQRRTEIEPERSITGAQRDTTRKKTEDRAEGLENRMDAAEKRIEGLEVKMAKVLKQLDEIIESRKDRGSKKKNCEGENDGGRGDEIGGDLDPPFSWMEQL